MKIKICKNGPYLVTGGIKLSEKIITPVGNGYAWTNGKILPQADNYALCRCGRSKNPPFCDSFHKKIKFVGTETASKQKYLDRAEIMLGEDLDLLDDRRCAFARFCHRQDGSVWELTLKSGDPQSKKEAIAAAIECPAGRLVATEKDGSIIEPKLEPSIEIIQDPDRGVSAGIYVKGYIEIESESGELYEKRNRVMLCRCGKSNNMPFCDATHVSIGFKDKIFKLTNFLNNF